MFLLVLHPLPIHLPTTHGFRVILSPLRHLNSHPPTSPLTNPFTHTSTASSTHPSISPTVGLFICSSISSIDSFSYLLVHRSILSRFLLSTCLSCIHLHFSNDPTILPSTSPFIYLFIYLLILKSIYHLTHPLIHLLVHQSIFSLFLLSISIPLP